MKKSILLALLMSTLLNASAQWVTIPDENFVEHLTEDYPECMDGNLMDTTCSAIINTTYLHLAPPEASSPDSVKIADLTGIEHFVNLDELQCWYNILTELPELPASLTKLRCASNNLTQLPELPGSLTHLICYSNNITSLPELPLTLTRLNCWDNELSELPALPSSLEHLSCSVNDLTELPELPNSLTHLWCSYNDITSLPQLPDSLLHLDCTANYYLTELPELPTTLEKLLCSLNQISCLPVLPSSITTPEWGGPEHLVLTPNDFECLPNYIPVMQEEYTFLLNYPLCDLADLESNPFGCNSIQGIAGSIFEDENTNCSSEAQESGLVNIPLELLDNEGNLLSTTYSYSNSIYNFTADTGLYSIQLETDGLPLQSSCDDPGIEQSVELTAEESSALHMDFGLECTDEYDFGTQSIVTSGLIFPGQEHELKIIAGDLANWFGIQCAEGVSGSVSIIISGPVSYVEPDENALVPNVSGNIQLTYEIDDFGILDLQESFNIILATNTTAQSGDQICIEVIIDPIDNDINPENNVYTHCYEVVNSYDPNIKQVWPQDVELGYDDYFTYTVYFQNTGTAPAFNIRIADTLDTNLDLSTFQVTGYSHECLTYVEGNVATFRFNNIMLPDSTSDFEGSIGYVQYRIKPLADLPVGTVIENTAHIFFDFNDAIVTNTTQNEYVISTSANHSQQQLATVFPNPGTGQFNVLLRGVENGLTTHLEVYNLNGKRVLQRQVNENRVQLDLSEYPSGMYMLHLRNARGSEAVKLLKQ